MAHGALVLMGLFIAMVVPLSTYFFAKRMGRNPLAWFFISLVLPFIATIILFFLPDLSEKNQIK
ncbi:MAG: hypothetical protein J0M08_01105 [Bacteroidetes bacterium]|nr:hypothetical protein [Bacteroidota bacterium]